MATFSPDRKRRIFDHIKNTSNFVTDSNQISSNMNARKQRIMEHIERTRG